MFRASWTISFSLIPSASVTSLYRATAAFTEKATGPRGRFLMEHQGYLKGRSQHVMLMCPPEHTHTAATSTSPHDPVSVFHSCCCNRWTDGQGAPGILPENNYLPQNQSYGPSPPPSFQMWKPKAREQGPCPGHGAHSDEPESAPVPIPRVYCWKRLQGSAFGFTLQEYQKLN